MLFALSICMLAILLFEDLPSKFGWCMNYNFREVLMLATVFTLIAWIGLWFWTHQFFGEWIGTFACVALVLGGIGFYFLLPVSSMTNPPVNWGYPRTPEGFIHVLSRGQFERLTPTGSFTELLTQWRIYWKIALADLGPMYVGAALVPFVFLRRFASPARRWLIGMVAVWFFVSLLMLVGLNVSDSGAEFARSYFVPTHVIVAMFGGCGLMLLTAQIARPQVATSKRLTSP